ncbi:MAG: putative glycoside hydrolase [Candidatus Paceibacterota bacterium]|jgi:hypothetical protein
MLKGKNKILALALAGLFAGFVLIGGASRLPFISKYLQASSVYVRDTPEPIAIKVASTTQDQAKFAFIAPVVALHEPRPEKLKAIYISSWSAGSATQMKRLIGLIDRTEINAVVIDIKDATGEIAFHVNDPALKAMGTESNRIGNIDSLIKELHAKNIYVIGRVSTFQDPLFAKIHPELAVIRKSDGKFWRDRKGLSWLDAGAKKTWDYIIAIAKESYSRGFDEINFDYIRFPSDGNMKDIAYRFYDEAKLTKPAQMKLFYEYLHNAMQDSPTPNPSPKERGGIFSSDQGLSSRSEAGRGESLVSTAIPHSADLFGMTTTADDDMGIGQMLTDALPYFDYICPMIYPSHYGPGINGYKKPAQYPYEMVAYALEGALAKASSTDKWQGESLPKGEGLSLPPSYKKIVPWLQDFDMGATYDAGMVRAQIKATEDAGLTSWLLWDPANRYTEGALQKE